MRENLERVMGIEPIDLKNQFFLGYKGFRERETNFLKG